MQLGNKIFQRNSIVYSPTTVHLTNRYMLFWSDYTRISNTIIWYDSGMSRIPPIPPQSGIAVGFDFVGKFVN
jgi:hypothetical protein